MEAVIVELISLQEGWDESVASLAAQFQQNVQPLGRKSGKRCSRQKVATSWNSVVTWAAALNVIKALLPISESTLRALLWDAISVGSSLSVLKMLVNAVQAQHGIITCRNRSGNKEDISG